MAETVITAIITGGLALIGTVITVLATSKKTTNAMQVSQAVMAEKLENLSNEVKKHNDFAVRVPVLEEKANSFEHRISDLEKRGK